MVEETKLSGHKQFKKELKPPFAQIPITPVSWINDRMPDMLWAVLIIGNWQRDKALDFFRYIAKFVEGKQDCFDITLTGIGTWKLEDRKLFLDHIMKWAEPELVRNTLQPMTLFPELPGFQEWQTVLGEADSTQANWKIIADGIVKCMWHQSEEATDCRWIKFLCQIHSGKFHFSNSIKDIKETIRGILEYPNYGDLQHVRSFIRAFEMVSRSEEETANKWAKYFWEISYKSTSCVPLSLAEKDDYKPEQWDTTRDYYIEETKKVRFALIDYFLETSETTAIDAKHYTAFGFAFYAFTLFTEIILCRLDYSVTGHLTLRALVECYITFSYLVQKNEPELWDSYRAYGSGQAKLIYLKLQQLKNKPKAVNEKNMYEIANEDQWLEFVSINIGHWDNTDLRKMSEEAGLKEIYDQYYAWTSGYMHANWMAIRESVYEKCINPLHRLHALPTRNFTKLSPVVDDAREITNKVLELLDNTYPKFEIRISPPPETDTTKTK